MRFPLPSCLILPPSPDSSGRFACPGSLVVCGKRYFASNEWADDKVHGAFEFLIGFFYLPSLMRNVWHLSFLQREWEGGRHLEGGISELSILPTAQQVKVTLHFMYFPPISICEQNLKKKNRGRHRTQENKKWWKMREKTIISHSCSQIYNTSYCFKQNDVSFGWSYNI